MDDIKTMARLQFKRRIRNRRSLLWTILFPLAIVAVFALVFLSGSSFSANLVVIDEDQSLLSLEIVGAIQLTSHVNLIFADSRGEGVKMLDQGEADAVFVIPAGLQDAMDEIRNDPTSRPEVTFEVYYRGEDIEQLDVIQIVLEGLAADVNDYIMPGYDGPIQIVTHPMFETGWGYIDLLVPLSVGVVLIESSVYAASNAIAFLKENNIKKRLRCTPSNSLSLAFGMVIAEGTLAGFSALIATAAGMLLFVVPVTIFEVVMIILVVFFSSYIFALLGVVLGNLSRNQLASQALSSLIVLPLIFFSSAYILPAIFPQSLKGIAHALPLGQATHSLKLLFLHNPTIVSLAPSIAGLLAWGGAFLLIIYWQERK